MKRIRTGALAVCIAVMCLLPGVVLGQRTDYVPPELEDIDITDRSGESVDPGLEFLDETGARVRLGDYLGRDMPVVVQLGYFECPMLCSLVLNGFLAGARELDWKPGQEYVALSVSIDPDDTPALAKDKQANYVAALGDSTAADGWHFLTAADDAAPGEGDVRRLADQLGFQYRYVEDTDEFAHGAGIFVLTPDGTISRTLYGMSYPATTLRFSLMEASEGRLGTPLQKVVLFCFAYDADKHGYTLVALNVMKLGGLLTVVALGTFVGVLWIRERSRTGSPPDAGRARQERA